jgi:hypothetical protein
MSDLLASDADRERIAERLRAAAGEGRLTPAELEERLESAFSARTDAELEPLVADLPARPQSRARVPRDHAPAGRDLGAHRRRLLLAHLADAGLGHRSGRGSRR